VKCRNASIECFDIPLLRPLHVQGNELLSRQGAYLVLVDELGHQAMGECSPLPGLSAESFDRAHAQLKGLASRLIGKTLLEPCRAEDLDNLFPSVRMALDMAIMDLTWQRCARFSDSGDVSVALNGLVMGQDKEASASVVALLEQGYRSIKIKVARQSLSQDIENVTRIRSQVAGRAGLRLDANRSWSLDQACDFARALGAESIEYIEEPTQKAQDHSAFWQATGMRVALDESLCDGVVPDELLGEWIGAFVLKPAMIGNLSQVKGLIDRAEQLDIPAVLSSVFESPVALQFYARLAFVHGLQHQDHGLDTWRWLRPGPEDLPFEIRQGCLVL
jgi:o-succinylbenzoate synthase